MSSSAQISCHSCFLDTFLYHVIASQALQSAASDVVQVQIAVVHVSAQTSAVYILLKRENDMSKLDKCGLRGILIQLHTQKSHNLSTRCVRNRLVASLSTSCNIQGCYILLSCYKFVTHNYVNKLLNCRTINGGKE